MMTKDIDPLKDAILRYLSSLARNSGIISVSVDDIAKNLKVNSEKIEKILIKLEGEGYIRFHKVPLTKTMKNYLAFKVAKNDALRIMGDISDEDYMKNLSQISQISGMKYVPLPRLSIADLMKALEGSLQHLVKLQEKEGELDEDVYNDLWDEYINGLKEVLVPVQRYLKALETIICDTVFEIKKIYRELEKIKADTAIRGVDRQTDLRSQSSMAMRHIEKLEKVSTLLKGLTQKEASNVRARKKELLERLARLKDERDILKAKLLIAEEDSPELLNRKKEIEDQIARIESEIRSLDEELMKDDSSNTVTKVVEIKLRKLKEMSIKKEHNEVIAEVSKLLGKLDRIHYIFTEEWPNLANELRDYYRKNFTVNEEKMKKLITLFANMECQNTQFQ